MQVFEHPKISLLFTREIKRKAECRSMLQQSGDKAVATENLRIKLCWLDIYGRCRVIFAGLCSRVSTGSRDQPVNKHSALRPACLNRFHTWSVTLTAGGRQATWHGIYLYAGAEARQRVWGHCGARKAGEVPQGDCRHCVGRLGRLRPSLAVQ